MCLIAFAIGAHPACPLLIAGNRDEFFERPTAPLHRWTPPGSPVAVWAGRDLRDGGTWLGFGENGRVAMLTNVRSAQPGSGARSRGELPLRWLASHDGVESLADGIDPAAYGGFNLVVGDFPAGRWAWLSNRDPADPHTEGAATQLQWRTLSPGIYGVSNAALDTPWPKTERLKAAMRQALDQWDSPPSGDMAGQHLAQALAENAAVPDAHLPPTGVPQDWERALSSPFVDMAERGYGTRSSLLARVTVSPGTAQPLLTMTEWRHERPTAGAHRWSAAPPAITQVTW